MTYILNGNKEIHKYRTSHAKLSKKIRSQQWRDRLKIDPDAYQSYLQSARERYLRRKESASKKFVKRYDFAATQESEKGLEKNRREAIAKV